LNGATWAPEDIHAFLARDERFAGLRFRPLAMRAALHLPCTQVNVVGSRTGTSFTVDHVTSVAPGIKSAQVAGASVAQVDGRFTVAHHDNFETGSSQFLYQVFDARGGATEIAMPFLPGSLATGMEVNVEGTVAEDGQSIVPNQIMIQGIPPVLEASATTTYLVIPIKFPTTAAAPWAYNADPFTPAALNTAVFGNLPTKSVKDALFTFFTSKRIKVAGEQTSFNALEKETIRSKFSDPRVHFALNCASQSCPPLSQSAFRGSSLDGQLDRLARSFVNTPKGVNYQEGAKSAELSKIFDWYKGDFKEGALPFINQRRAKPLPADVKITYQEYDWSLNEAR